jgi:hypothetical protein
LLQRVDEARHRVEVDPYRSVFPFRAHALAFPFSCVWAMLSLGDSILAPGCLQRAEDAAGLRIHVEPGLTPLHIEATLQRPTRMTAPWHKI